MQKVDYVFNTPPERIAPRYPSGLVDSQGKLLWGAANIQSRTVLYYPTSPEIGDEAIGFTSGVAGFAGFRFAGDDNNTFYGWARITHDTSDPGTIPVNE